MSNSERLVARLSVTGVEILNSSNHYRILCSSALEMIITKIIPGLWFLFLMKETAKDIFSLLAKIRLPFKSNDNLCSLPRKMWSPYIWDLQKDRKEI